MVKLDKGTIVTFPMGSLSETSKIVQTNISKNGMGEIIFFTEKTPFHPVDNNWPDQPTDKGFIRIKGKDIAVNNAITCAMDVKNGNMFFDSDITARKGDENWIFLVAHIANNTTQANSIQELVGEEVFLSVDKNLRRNISASHTACHLMALALNKSTKQYWKKEVERDSLGNPNFDKLGIQKSLIEQDLSSDFYRLGKSLRKKGLDSDAFFKEIKQTEEKINFQIDEWLKTKEAVYIESPNLYLDSKRWWVCRLDNIVTKIPCGGTHINSLDEFQSINVKIEVNATEPEINIFTYAKTSDIY